MDKIEYRAVIKYLFLKGNTPTQIKDELDSVYGDSASFTTIKFWLAEIKRGRAYYASLLDKLKTRTCGKTAPLAEKENPVSPGQRTVSQLKRYLGENPRIKRKTLSINWTGYRDGSIAGRSA
ncbi:HTH_48 domain-containing protein [Trichonephila clavipes]|nr:HTH_48 domain-containing protein [Trichonephila clavipes]